MPSTLAGLVGVIGLLIPGIAFVARRESRLPPRQHSPLRETATVMAISTATNLATGAVFAVVRAWSRIPTPDVGALIADPSAYAAQHHGLIAAWAAILLILSTVMAAFLAAPPAPLLRTASRLPGRLGRAADLARQFNERPRIVHESMWSWIFEQRPNEGVGVGIVLVDDTYLYGELAAYSHQLSDSQDRSVVLRSPIMIRAPKMPVAEPLHAEMVHVTAHHIKTLTVHHHQCELDPTDRPS